MKIGIVQYSPAWEDEEKNFEKVSELIEKNALDEKIIILPEMSFTGYTMNSEKFAEEIDGFTITRSIKLAQIVHKHLFVGLIERDGDQVYNSLFHFDPNGIIVARYRKIHPFSYAKEDQHYSAGEETTITKVDDLKIGLSICYDLRFPELYRFYAKEQVDLLVNIANWPVQRIEHWKALLRARAIENQAYMIGVNRTGTDPFYEYNGRSGVYDPMGHEIFLADEEENFFSIEIDDKLATETKEKLPFLRDMKLV